MATEDTVLVVGSGPAGLSCAAELIARGVDATVVERGTQIGAAWAHRYDALRFNTCRRNSALPGAPFPHNFGQFPTRDQYVDYLQTYAACREVRVRLGVEVNRLDPAPDGGWDVVTNRGVQRVRQVVVATGIFNRPALPDWAEGHDFTGRVVHAAQYRNASAFAGQRVLVAGAGSTGLEIAYELSRSGCPEVSLAVRTPPNILLREVGGLPADLPLPLFLRLPTGLVDKMLQAMQRRVIGDLSGFGLTAPREGPIAGLKRRGAGTAIVDREVIDAIRDRSLRVVPAVDRLEHRAVVLVDGTTVQVDSVIAATGYRTGLDAMVGHLDVLDQRGMPRDGYGGEVLPGLRFVGYVYRPGLTKFVGGLARRVADDIARQLSASKPLTPDDEVLRQ
ncbi:flavin-containing monooxygenase [Mycolicibacterium celeriflavum]|uniref:Monooxygenase n=1 Tax=Mycolicibacterium celeriflavum TaxID=1249101 RepID=A0A1X0BTK7_MYCCF|nr:NAD(P)/FAD-dependent oxidoreductase [Mycolicibacterium celeriflavum]MCV7239876.1 NAD(P)/FAD-dependent oxidoreductase [Mycolicibacterium celeriflavum]ORA47210.1 pyridine nucleotide-disulfide oxidoreductase [Mycolicibacterium celeriflavum]BBY44280.1 monooxygenase [Mycolicibacterium celeriflavum]